jgi:hypothetical protein
MRAGPERGRPRRRVAVRRAGGCEVGRAYPCSLESIAAWRHSPAGSNGRSHEDRPT